MMKIDADHNLSKDLSISSPHSTDARISFGNSIIMNEKILGIGSGFTSIGGTHTGSFYVYDNTNGDLKDRFNPEPVTFL